MAGKYSIELFRECGEGVGIEGVLVRRDTVHIADDHIERLRKRLFVSNTICISFALGWNFRTRHECCARNDRSRSAKGRN